MHTLNNAHKGEGYARPEIDNAPGLAETEGAKQSAIHQQNNAQSTNTGEEFNTLRHAFAQHGHRLHSVTAPGGNTTYWAERWGLVRYLPSLHDAALFLAQTGGRL